MFVKLCTFNVQDIASYRVEEDDYFMSSLVQGKPEGQKWGCWHYLFAEINGGTYVMFGVIKLFSEKSPGDELRITKTGYDLNHKEVNSLVDIDPIPILREMRKELKRI